VLPGHAIAFGNRSRSIPGEELDITLNILCAWSNCDLKQSGSIVTGILCTTDLAKTNEKLITVLTYKFEEKGRPIPQFLKNLVHLYSVLDCHTIQRV
jgi:hypothetical protein